MLVTSILPVCGARPLLSCEGEGKDWLVVIELGLCDSFCIEAISLRHHVRTSDIRGLREWLRKQPPPYSLPPHAFLPRPAEWLPCAIDWVAR